MSQHIRPWWENDRLPPLAEINLGVSVAKEALILDWLRSDQTGEPVYEGQRFGVLSIKNMKAIVEEIEALGFKRAYVDPDISEGENEGNLLCRPDGAVYLWSSDTQDGQFHFAVRDVSVFDKLVKLAETYIKKTASHGRAYVIVSSSAGMRLRSIGVAGLPLERSNYDQDVLEDYDAIVEDLSSPTPSGRLAILDGPAGTGKTYMIRALMDAVPDAVFILMNANMIPALSSPSFLSVLINNQIGSSGNPTILLCEDADDCLGSRDASNVNAVSALLNLGDGILGSLFDLRLVCTTNLKNEELDEAVVRPGRLSRKIHIDPLSPETAKNIYVRLTGKEPEFKLRNMTLAEVYVLARDNGWKPVKQTKSMGFSTPMDDIFD